MGGGSLKGLRTYNVPVTPGQTGTVQTLSSTIYGLTGPVTFAKISGNANITLGSGGALGVTSGLSAGNSQSIAATFTSADTPAWQVPVTVTVSCAATAPLQVTGLGGTPGDTQVALSWTAPGNGGSAITDYVVQYGLSGSGVWTTFSHTASTATNMTVTGLTNGLAYDFRGAAVNAVGTGTFSATATATPSNVATPPTLADITPATLIFNTGWIAFGDSTTYGVGATNSSNNTGTDWPSQSRATATSNISVTWHGGGANTTPMQDVQNSGESGYKSIGIYNDAVTNFGANPGEFNPSPTPVDFITSWGINDTNGAATPVGPADKAWAVNSVDRHNSLKSLFATAQGLWNGPAAPQGSEPGQLSSADWRANFLYAKATLTANRVSDLTRMLRHYREMQGGMTATSANRLQIDFGGIPLDYRQETGTTAAFTPPATDQDPLQGTVVPTVPTYDGVEGTLYNNTSSNIWYRKRGGIGAGSWSAFENAPKHFVPNGYGAISALNNRFMAAANGTGPAQPLYDMVRVKSDIGNGATICAMRVLGTATDWAIYSDYAGTVPTEVTINRSTGVVTRTGVGSLTRGLKTYIVVAASAGGYQLTCPLDVYTGAASTVTIPPSLTISNSPKGIALGSRWDHGMTDSTSFTFVFVGAPTTTGAGGYLFYTAGPNVLQIQINASGLFRAWLYDSSNAIIGSTPTVSVGTVTNNAQIAIGFSMDVSSGQKSLWFTTSGGEVDKTASVTAATGATAIPFSTGFPMYLNSGAPATYLKSAANAFAGVFHRMWLGPGFTDFSNSANRRVLYSAVGAPVAAASYSQINSITPWIDLWGDRGDIGFGLPPDVTFAAKPKALIVPTTNFQSQIA